LEQWLAREYGAILVHPLLALKHLLTCSIVVMARDVPDIRFYPVSGSDSRHLVLSGCGGIVRYPAAGYLFHFFFFARKIRFCKKQKKIFFFSLLFFSFFFIFTQKKRFGLFF